MPYKNKADYLSRSYLNICHTGYLAYKVVGNLPAGDFLVFKERFRSRSSGL